MNFENLIDFYKQMDANTTINFENEESTTMEIEPKYSETRSTAIEEEKTENIKNNISYHKTSCYQELKIKIKSTNFKNYSNMIKKRNLRPFSKKKRNHLKITNFLNKKTKMALIKIMFYIALS